MNIVETTLPNGLRVIAIGRPGTSTVASKLFPKSGNRHDGERNGIGHCLEHALFCGTTTRSSREPYGAMEALGGRIQGETVEDYLALDGPQDHRRAKDRQALDERLVKKIGFP